MSLAVLGIFLLVRDLPGADSQRANGFDHFITRQGSRLYDGEKQFRFIGANMPGLMVPYDFSLRLPERMTLPSRWEQEDGFKTLDQMNMRVIRTWNLPIRGPADPEQPWHYVLGPNRFNEEAFRVLDSMFDLCNRYGIRVIFDFTADYGDFLGGVGTYAAHRGKMKPDFFTDPQIIEDFKDTIRHVVLRVNSLTGVRYCEDKAVLAWQFGNEIDHAPDSWHANIAAYLKRLAPHQLVMDSRHESPSYIDTNVDIVSRHMYPDYRGLEAGFTPVVKERLTWLAGKRPLIVGEFGPYIYKQSYTHANVVERLREFLGYVVSEKDIPGVMFWSIYFHREAGGFYWHQIGTSGTAWSYHWPGFLSADSQREIGILHTLREAAFEIQGLPVPSIPKPEAPTLHSFADVPMFSWRGSTGASGYDIERSAELGGPWTPLAINVSDADTAYRPLFSDTTAQVGDVWYYRTIARNSSGTSAPSNVIGPVSIKAVCLVDEMQNFDLVCAKSGGLSLVNDRNRDYAEYLFRVKGNSGDWMTYELPTALTAIRLVGFGTEGTADLVLQVSPDGNAFSDISPDVTRRLLGNSFFKEAGVQPRLMTEYNAAVSSGNRFLRIVWKGEAELDRLEAYYAGAK